MAFSVEFGIMRKNKNSLSTHMTTVNTYNCTLLDKTSITRPTFRVREPMSPYPFSMCNYCHCAEFARYYYIQDITWSQEGWLISCSSDALASHKLAIIASHAVYIERAESEYDGKLLDSLYPLNSNVVTQTRTVESPWKNALEGQSFASTIVVSVQGKNTTYVACYDKSQLDSFFGELYSDKYCDQMYEGGSIWKDQFKQMKAQLNIPQYINSIDWFPCIATGSASPQDVVVGFGKVTAPGVIKDPGIEKIELNFDISNINHPQAQERGEYLNLSPYTEYYLNIPPFGGIQIPGVYVKNLNGSLKAVIYVDMHTGVGRLIVHDQNNTERPYIAQMTAKISVPLKHTNIVQTGAGMFDLMATGFQGGAGVIESMGRGSDWGVINNYAAMAGTLIRNYAQGFLPLGNTSGTTGGLGALYGVCMFSAVHHTIVDEDIQQYGRPLYKTKTIGDLQGFIKVANADNIDVGDATVEEMQEIRQACLEGIYNEA